MKRGAPLKRTAFRRRPGWTPPATSSARSLHPANGLRNKGPKNPIPAATRRVVHERSQGRCEAPEHAPACEGRAEHIHHRKLRSQGGSNNPGNLLDLSRACHRWHHDHPARAAELGIIVPSWQIVDRPELYDQETAS